MMNNRLTFGEAELLQTVLKAGIRQMREVLATPQKIEDFETAMAFLGKGGKTPLSEQREALEMQMNDLQSISDKLFDIFGI